MGRFFFVLLLSLASLLSFGGTAGAVPRARATAELAQAPAEADKPAAPLAPHDVPLVLPSARAAIPPVPASYVTKDLGWLELAYPPAAAERVASMITDADAIKTDLASKLGQEVLTKVIVRVAPTVADMAKLAPADAPPPDYASGVAYHGLHLVLLSMLAPRGAEAVDLDETFRHELAHVALEDAVQGRHVPVWFNEGLAIALSGELAMARTKTLWNATLSGTLIPLADLDRGFPHDNFEVSIAYAESADFMKFLTRRSDRLRFVSMIERVRDGAAFERAVADAFGSDLRRLEFEWRGSLEQRFSVLPILTGGGIVWVLLIGALGYAYIRKKRRAKAILDRWAREEAIEDAVRAKLAEREDAAVPTVFPVAIKVDDHGRWHTLH
jgi:hypothetical protein